MRLRISSDGRDAPEVEVPDQPTSGQPSSGQPSPGQASREQSSFDNTLLASADLGRSQSRPYAVGEGVGTPYGNLVFKGPGDDGFLHVQSRTSDYRVPTHLGNDRDEIRAWAIRSVEQGHIDRNDLYTGSQGQPAQPARAQSEPYRNGDGIGTPYGNLIYRGVGDDGYLHVQSRTSDYRVPAEVGNDRDAVRAWAIRSVEQGHIDRSTLYVDTPGRPGTPAEQPSRPFPQPYRDGDGIGTPYGNLVFRGVGDDGYLHVQSRTADYRVPIEVGNDRNDIRAWAIRSVEQGHIDRNALYQPNQSDQPTQAVPRSEIAAPQRSPQADGFIYSSQLNDRLSGDFPRDAQGNATIPAEWRNGNTPLDMWRRTAVGNLNRETDDQLLFRFNAELQLASHFNPIANQLLEHFVSNTGRTFNSPPGSPWSELIRNDGEGQRIAGAITGRIYDMAEQQYARTGRVDLGTMTVPLTHEDRAVWGNKPNSPAFGAFGSTDGLQVEIQNARFDPETKQITGNARITIIDTFGLSNSDNDSPGQIAMWLLQHQRGYQPFVHQVQFDVPLDWTVRTQRPNGGGLQPTP